jgi:hypothetical protein
MVLIAAVVIVGVGAAGLVGLRTWRWPGGTQTRSAPRSLIREPCPRSSEWRGPLSRSRRRGLAIGRAPDIHLHLHGVSAEDIAAILARNRLPGPAVNRPDPPYVP